MSQSRPDHLGALTGLRFVAALLVVLYHLAPPYLGAAPGWVRGLVGGGFVGVSLFFVLSGFILAYTYLPALRRGPLDRRGFWVARLARVYPVYLLGLLLALPPLFERFVQAAGGSTGRALGWLGRLGAAVVPLLQAWSPDTACVWNCPGWSLSAEAFFYLVFPFAIPVAARWRGKRLALAACGLYLAALAPPLVYGLLGPDAAAASSLAHTGATKLVKYHPLLRLPEFLLGVLLGRWFVDARAGSAPAWLPRLGGVALLATAGVLTLSTRLPYLLLHNGLLAPLFALIIVALGWGGGRSAALLAMPPLRRLGEASYALYILHLPLWAMGERAARAAGFTAFASPLYLLAYLALALATSLLTLRYVEEPARRWIRARYAERARGAAPAAAALRRAA